MSFVPFESGSLVSGDGAQFCSAVRARLDDYAGAGVTWITIEPASRSFSDFRADIELIASQLIHH